MGKNRLVKQPNGDIIQRWGDGKEKWIVHCDNGKVSGIQNSLPCRSAEDRKFKSGEVLTIKIEDLEYGVNGIIPGIGDQDLEIFYDGDIVEKRYNKYLEGLPGFLPLGFEEIMVKVDKGAAKGKIKKGYILGYIIFSTECENREEPKEIIEPEKEEWTRDEIREAMKFDETLPTEKQEELLNVLEENKAVLSKGDDDIGRACITAHKIELYDQTPIRQRPRRLPEPVTRAVEEQCAELMASDVIEPSKSPWSAPIVPIMKKKMEPSGCVWTIVG